MMGKIKALIVGIAHDPQFVGAARAFAFYVLPILASLLVGWLSGITDPKWLGVPLAAIPFIRALEGALDRVLKSTQNDTYPQPPAGAGPTP